MKVIKMQILTIEQRIGVIKAAIPYKEEKDEEAMNLFDEIFEL